MTAALACALGTVVSCGTPAQPANDPAARQQQLMQTVELNGSPDAKPRPIPVALGKIAYVRVTSGEPGEARIPSYGLAQPVRAGEPAVLVFSADRERTADVVMHRNGVDDVIAHLNVADSEE